MNYTEIIEKQRAFYKSGQTRSYAFRIEMLKKLQNSINTYETQLLDALKYDLNKPHFEGFMAEIGIVLQEIRHTIKHLRSWLKPIRVKSALMHFPAKSYRIAEPLGVVLIMSPWNYPLQLTLAPLIAAISAGNCVVVKPSRFSKKTSEIIKIMLEETFSSDYITVFEGGSEVNNILLDIRFDHIFFTGSPMVGKIVMEKAAKFLCPVTLELGGKSPCIVHEDANIPLAARRIMWGKSINSGQTCVAPDYLYVHESVKNKLIDCMKHELENFYGKTTICSDFCKIINERHYNRLKNLLNDGDIIFGGGYNDKTQQIEMTLIENFSSDSELIRDEIFGPIMPVITYNDINEVVEKINDMPKPLAFYAFSNDKKLLRDLINRIPFGGGTLNDVVMHLTNINMPFGGIGDSGMGGYHGYKGFESFSHIKSIMYRGSIDIKLRYAPYTHKIDTIKMLMK